MLIVVEVKKPVHSKNSFFTWTKYFNCCIGGRKWRTEFRTWKMSHIIWVSLYEFGQFKSTWKWTAKRMYGPNSKFTGLNFNSILLAVFLLDRAFSTNMSFIFEIPWLTIHLSNSECHVNWLMHVHFQCVIFYEFDQFKPVSKWLVKKNESERLLKWMVVVGQEMIWTVLFHHWSFTLSHRRPL